MNRALFLSVMLCMAAFGSSAAQAEQVEDTKSFDLVVSGKLAEQCSLGSIADMDFGNLERAGLGAEAQVAFNCNIPFTMTVKADRGALTHTTMPNGQGPYAGAIPYTVGINLPLRNPHQTTVRHTFNSRQAQAGGVISSNGGIATDGMTLAVELAPTTGKAGLLAGEYAETISITVSPL